MRQPTVRLEWEPAPKAKQNPDIAHAYAFVAHAYMVRRVAND